MHEQCLFQSLKTQPIYEGKLQKPEACTSSALMQPCAVGTLEHSDVTRDLLLEAFVQAASQHEGTAKSQVPRARPQHRLLLTHVHPCRDSARLRPRGSQKQTIPPA